MSNMFSFITNTNQSHKEEILKFFDESDRIVIAVGFLKPSGLRNIKNHLSRFCENLSKKVTFYVGIGLGETDPNTLQQMFNILNQNPNNELVICTPDAGIFHPKIYLFIIGSQVKIIIGSANLTEAGWLINDEFSVLVDTTIESGEYLQLNEYLQNLHDSYYTNDVLSLINDYKNQLATYKKDNRPGFHFKRREITIDDIDMPRLLAYYNAYLNSEEFINVELREEKYIQARTNLLVISGNARLSNQQFHDLFGPLVGHKGYQKLWHSGSIHRTTHKTLNYIPGFREIARKAQQVIDLPVSQAFDTMINLRKQMRSNNEIHGVGENILTEILMSFNPSKFANLNVNPIDVLSFLGKDFPSVATFKGSTYQEYIHLLSKIRDELNMRSFLEIDSFFNYVYWNIHEE